MKRLLHDPRLGRIDLAVLGSILVAGALAVVGLVRLASYYRGWLGAWVRESPLGFLAYDPTSYANVRYFKILASLSFVSFFYFLFRIFNRGHRDASPGYRVAHHRDIDFRSPWLRLTLVLAINVQWAIQEWYKFSTRAYPYSPLEDWRSNAIVLALSGLLAFFGMKHLSFRPLLK